MKVRTYVCAKGPGFNGCGGLTVVAEPLETLIVDALMIRLSSPELRRKIRRRTQKASDTSAPLADLAGIESQLRELAEMWAAGDIDRMSWSTAREALEARRREIGDHLALSVDDTRIAGSVGKPTDVAAEWRSMNLTRRAALLGSVIDHITIAPAIRGRNTFDADRVDVAWRA
jgi:site-specific DNA recombinase